jgi:hypothetical protein
MRLLALTTTITLALLGGVTPATAKTVHCKKGYVLQKHKCVKVKPKPKPKPTLVAPPRKPVCSPIAPDVLKPEEEAAVCQVAWEASWAAYRNETPPPQSFPNPPVIVEGKLVEPAAAAAAGPSEWEQDRLALVSAACTPYPPALEKVRAQTEKETPAEMAELAGEIALFDAEEKLHIEDCEPRPTLSIDPARPPTEMALERFPWSILTWNVGTLGETLVVADVEAKAGVPMTFYLCAPGRCTGEPHYAPPHPSESATVPLQFTP